MAKRELAYPIHHPIVKLSPEEGHGAIIELQFSCRSVSSYLGEWEYVVRILLLEGPSVQEPGKQHDSGYSSVL